MGNESISQNVRRFIGEHIRSVVELEVLLLMHSDSGRTWSAGELSEQMRVDAEWTQRELLELTRRGLVRQTGDVPPKYIYESASPDHATVEELAETYAQRRVSVISLIFAKPSDPIQSFADAFKLRKEPRDG
jgi:predicted transcriptional regulator